MRTFIPVAFGVVLLLAAYLKATALVTAPPPVDGGVDFASLFGWAAVGVEGGLAAWLLSGLAPAAARRGAIVVLAVFTVVAGTYTLLGKASCGCFGDAAVRPAWVFLLDLGFLVAFLLLKPRTAGETPWRTFRIAATAAVACGLTALLVADGARAEARTVYADPPAWVGRPFPLLAYVEDAAILADLARGDRTVLLVSRDCGACAEHLSSLSEHEPADIYIIEVAGRAMADRTPLPQVGLRDVRIVGRVPWEVRLAGGVVRDVDQSADTSTSHRGRSIHSRITASAGLFSGV